MKYFTFGQKNMKTSTILFLLISLCYEGFGQRISNNKFYTWVYNADSSQTVLVFDIDDETLARVKQTQAYKRILTDTTFLNQNLQEYSYDTLAIYLMAEVNFALMYVQLKIKSPESFAVPDHGEGLMYFYKGLFTITFPFQWKDTYGDINYSTGLVNSKDTFIYKR
jgi:hypothetical protein